MKKLNYRLVRLALLLLSVSLFTACGKKEATTDIANVKEYVYQYEELPINEEANEISNVFRSGESIIACNYGWQGEQTVITVYKLSEDGSGQEIIELVADGSTYYSNLCGDNLGNIYVMRTEYANYGTDEETEIRPLDMEAVADENDSAQAAEPAAATESDPAAEEDITTEDNQAEEDMAVAETDMADTRANPAAEAGRDMYYLVQYGPEGDLNWEICLNDERIFSDTSDGNSGYFYLNFVSGDNAGNLFIASNGKLARYDQEGNFQNEIILSGENSDVVSSSIAGMLTMEDNAVMLAYHAERGIAFIEIDPLTGALGQNYELPGNEYWYSYYPGVDYDIYLTDSYYLYGYNFGDAEITKIMNYLNSDLNIYSLENVIGISKEEFLGAIYDAGVSGQRLCRFSKVDPKDIKEKKVITVGSVSTYWEMRSEVVKFNKSNDTYRIQLVDYSAMEYAEEDYYAAALNRLNTDIASGNCPDVVLLEMGMPVESYNAKGLFADLYEFIDQDSELDRDQFMPNILAALSTDGHLYQIAPQYSISTIVGKTADVGTEPGWSLTEMKQLLATKPEGTQLFEDYTTQSTILYLAMTLGGDQFIDWKNGKCNYNSQSFIELLEFVSQFPGDDAEITPRDENYWNDYDSYWRTGKFLLRNINLSSLKDYSYIEKGVYGDEITMIGFPTEDGVGTSIYANMQMAVSAKSRNKEGAWEFIRYFLTDEYQEQITYYLPLSTKRLDELALEATQKSYFIDENGNKEEYDDYYYINGAEVLIPPMTQAEIEALKERIYSVDRLAVYSSELYNIIVEEAAPYFAGQKSVQEVVDIIQSRAQIFVSESR